ncbi:MAG: O-antigen ligase family protein [Myxococcales bacterium]|nr:MAG: O-antigen ligase family protein [Myxococcales bacterium]
MKYLVFMLTFIFGVPVGAFLARQSPKVAKVIFVLMVLAPLAKANINFFSHELYRGDARGLEIDLTDLLALMLFFAMALSSRYKLKLFPPHSLLFVVFYVFCIFSVLNAYVPLYSTFTLFRILRAWFVYIVAYNYLRHDPQHLRLAVGVFVAALLIQTGSVFKGKYLHGIYRAEGTFPHPNTLALYAEMLIPIALAVGLHRRSKWEGAHWIAVLGGMFCVLSTFSRGGMAILALSVAMTIGMSLLLRPTGRKAMLVAVLAMLGFAGVLKASDSIIKRFQEAPKASGEARDHFNAAAKAMADEHVFGIGLNNYPYALAETPYARHINYVKEEAGLCHHIYWLFAGETGYVGLGAYLLFMAGFFVRAVQLMLARPPNEYAALGVGVFGSFIGFHLHGLLEWAFRQAFIMYLFFIICALLAAAREHHQHAKRTEFKMTSMPSVLSGKDGGTSEFKPPAASPSHI